MQVLKNYTLTFFVALGTFFPFWFVGGIIVNPPSDVVLTPSTTQKLLHYIVYAIGLVLSVLVARKFYKSRANNF